MEASAQHQRILHDLALVYLALAHGADNRLDGAELDMVATRLEEVQAGLSGGTVLHAVKAALEAYTGEESAARVRQAVGNLRTSVPPAMRRRVIRDLTEIGKADDRFLFAEATFIGDLVAAWRQAPGAPAEADSATWSIFGQDHEGGWTLVHDLAFIYVTLAHRTDGALARAELRAISDKIGEWMPNAGPDDLRALLGEVLRAYDAEPEGRTFEAAVEAVRQNLPAHQRAAVLDDLRYVADADGVLLVEERVLIERLAEAWEAH